MVLLRLKKCHNKYHLNCWNKSGYLTNNIIIDEENDKELLYDIK